MRGFAVLVVAVLRAAAQTPDCAVRGEVRDAVTGAPVAKALVRLEPEKGPDGYTGTADAAGKFCFKAVTPGEYEASIEKPGYLRDKESFSVHVTAGQTADLTLQATPPAVIAGRVVDPDGEPVPDASVVVLAMEWVHGKRIRNNVSGDDANDRGEFRIDDLEPGRYAVMAYLGRGGPDPFAQGVRDAPGEAEWTLGRASYPEAAATDPSAAIELRAGQELSAIELKLPRVACFRVTGKGDLHVLDPGPRRLEVVALPMDGTGEAMDWESHSAELHPDGSFALRGLCTTGEVLRESSRAGAKFAEAPDPAAGRVAPAPTRFAADLAPGYGSGARTGFARAIARPGLHCRTHPRVSSEARLTPAAARTLPHWP